MDSAALKIDGSRTSGEDVRQGNVTAGIAVANIVRSSLGPVGLDKMLVDDIGDVTITNDGATILKLVEVEHPAAKILVELAQMQDDEIGDGTTSVVILAAELLKRANELVKQNIHPTNILQGYRLAMKEAVKYIKQNLTVKTDTLGKQVYVNAAKTTLSSKILNAESDLFANMCVDALMSVKTTNAQGENKYNVSSVNILKQHGKSVRESELIDGFALNCTRSSQAMPRRVNGAKIALVDFDLRVAKMKMGVQIVIKDPTQLEAVRNREKDIMKERIQLLLSAGANVILTTKGIDDMASKYLVENGVMGIRRVTRDDMKRIARLTGGTLLTTLVDMEGNESFDEASLGKCDEVYEERVSDYEMTYLRGCHSHRSQSIVLRGANYFMLDEMDRSIHDALCVVQRTLESKTVVPGGGSVEASLSIYLENFARTLASREQLAIAEFAEALLVIPKTLAINAALDATELVARLRAHHNTAQTDASKKHFNTYGLDLVNNTVRNNIEAGVLEPSLSKIKIIQFATEAALTILRIDELIKLNPKQQDQRHM